MPDTLDKSLLKTDSRVGTPAVTICFGLFAAGFLIAAIIAAATHHSSSVFLVLAAGMCAAAVVGWPWRVKRDEFVLRDDGLTSTRTNEHIPWRLIVRLTFGGKCCDPDSIKKSTKRRVQILLDDSRLTVVSEDISPGELYRRLWNILISEHIPILNDSVIEKYYKEQLAAYSDDQILAAGLASKLDQGYSVRSGGMLALLVATIFAFIAASTTDNSVVAIVFAVIGSIILVAGLVLAVIGSYRRKKDELLNGGIVISRFGLALRNRQLKGEMKWRELLKVELAPSPARPLGLRLKLAGVTIVLAEEYQLPLWYLYRQINVAMLNPVSEPTNGPMFVDTQAIAKPIDHSNPYMPPPQQ